MKWIRWTLVVCAATVHCTPGVGEGPATVNVGNPAPSTSDGLDSLDCPGSAASDRHLLTGNDKALQLYRRGTKALDGGDEIEGRQLMLKVVEEHASSPLVPHAHLVLGERFFVEAKKDVSKASLAAEFFRKVLTSPPPENRAFYYAALRLAEMGALGGDLENANDGFTHLLEGTKRHADLPCMAVMFAGAKTALAEAYARTAQPAKAYSFYEHRTHDEAATLAWMVELVNAYVRAHRSRDAETVAAAVLERSPSAEVCASLQDAIDEHALTVPASSKCP